MESKGPGLFSWLRWWFQKQMFILAPILGEMIQFDLRIFFKWVGSTTIWMGVYKNRKGPLTIERLVTLLSPLWLVLGSPECHGGMCFFL